jgi:hypothetical protein
MARTETNELIATIAVHVAVELAEAEAKQAAQDEAEVEGERATHWPAKMEKPLAYWRDVDRRECGDPVHHCML